MGTGVAATERGVTAADEGVAAVAGLVVTDEEILREGLAAGAEGGELEPAELAVGAEGEAAGGGFAAARVGEGLVAGVVFGVNKVGVGVEAAGGVGLRGEVLAEG